MFANTTENLLIQITIGNNNWYDDAWSDGGGNGIHNRDKLI